MQFTALVLGSTGLVGNAFIKHLIQVPSCDQIIALGRRAAHVQADKVRSVEVDFDNLSASAAAFNGDILFSCLGTTLSQAGSLAAQRKVDYQYQFDAARIAAEQGVAHYVLVSSSGADASSFSPYLKMKGELENAVKDLPFETISLVQPSLLLGARETPRRAEGIAAHILPTLCKLPGLTRYRPITGEQVASKLVRIAEQVLHLNSNVKVQRYTLDALFE